MDRSLLCLMVLIGSPLWAAAQVTPPSTEPEPEPNTTPGTTGYNTTMGAPGYNTTTGDPGYNMTTGDLGYNTTMVAPGYNMTTGDPGYNTTTGNPGYNMTTSDPGYNDTIGNSTVYTTGVCEENHQLDATPGVEGYITMETFGNATCGYTIRAPEGYQIYFKLEAMSMPAPWGFHGCKYAFLKLFDGVDSSGSVMSTMCGQAYWQPRRTSITLGSNAFILAKADNTPTNFTLRYSLVPKVCGGNLTGTDYGYLSSSVGYPYFEDAVYPNNMDCTWRISVPEGLRISLNFIHVELEKCSGYDEVTVYDGLDPDNATVLAQLCDNHVPVSITTSGNELMLTMTTDDSIQFRGFEAYYTAFNESTGPSTTPTSPNTTANTSGCNGGVFTTNYGQINSPNFPDPYPNNLYCTYRIEAPIGQIVVVEFWNFTVESPCHYDSMKIYEGYNITSAQPVATLCGSNYQPPYISTSEVLWLVFSTDGSVQLAGFNLTYHFENPPSTTASPNSTTPASSSNGTTPAGSSNGTTPAGSSNGTTPDRSSNNTTPSGCNSGVFTTNYGHITSPNYPNNYGNGLDCTYYINAPVGQIVVVEFTDFQLDAGCRQDSLKVYDGNSTSDRRIDWVCGNTLPGPYRSSSENLLLVLTTDDANAHQGFSLSYHFETFPPANIDSAPTYECGASPSITTSPGIVTSPNYPNRYSNNEDCTLSITAPAGYRVALTFTDFDVEGSGCNYDSVQIFYSFSAVSTIQATLCGSSLPRSYTSTDRYMTVLFTSDDVIRKNGFRAIYQFIPSSTSSPPTQPPTTSPQPTNSTSQPSTPGTTPTSGNTTESTQSPGCNIGVFTTDYGHITSPNYPNNYDNFLSCTYHIRAPVGQIVVVEFTTFTLEPCGYDYLYVYDGNTTYDPMIGQLCGSTIPGPYRSRSENLLLVLQTDDSSTYPGFNLTYHFETVPTPSPSQVYECGTQVLTITTAPGVLTSRNYPSTYPNYEDCTLSITAPANSRVVITFTYFDVEEDTSCQSDALDIYFSSRTSSTSVAKLCGSSLPQTYTTRGRYLSLRLTSDQSATGSGFRAIYQFVSDTTSSPPTSSTTQPPTSSTTQPPTSSTTQPPTSSTTQPPTTSTTQPPTSSTTQPPTISTNPPPPTTTEPPLMQCGETSSVPTAALTSPNYPSDYPNNNRCTFKIQAPAGMRVRLTFESFRLESASRCQYDYVQVYDGLIRTSGDLLQTLCGISSPLPIVSTGSGMLVYFSSDYSVVRSGFRAVYTFVAP